MGWSVVLVVFTLATLSSIDSSVISTMDFAVHPGQVVFSDSSTASQTCGEHTRFGACLWRCLDRSADCTGVVLDRTTGCCAVFSDPPDVDKNGRILLGPVESTKISGYKEKFAGWRLVFKATDSISSVYNTFMSSDTVTSPTAEHLSLTSNCTTTCWYKHPLVENWSNVPIHQVKLALYEGGKEVVALEFFGRNSSKTNWFSVDRLLSSPWTDLTPADPPLYFSIDGFAVSSYDRRFYVTAGHGGCHIDNGWFFVLKRDTTTGCGWDRTGGAFAYSRKNTRVAYERDGARSPEMGSASVFAIFVKLDD